MDEHKFEMMRFNLPKDSSSIIKVIGVGGGGNNAVNYMYEQGIKGVDFIVCNTDSQTLDKSPVPTKIQLGATLTEGRGAGSQPEVGKNAAVETLDEIKDIISSNTTMVFITAGMGGGTGTGAAPIIAKAAREMGILTVGIVTIPFVFEGKKRKQQADQGLQEMREAVDTLLIIKNDKLRELYGNLSLKAAFGHADEVLCTAAKGIAEVITLTGEINVDMNDVNTVMKNSGVAIMGSAKASGEGRAMRAVSDALESPLLNDNDITGANFVLLNITYGNEEVLMDEITEITDYIQEQAGMSAEVIWGYGQDENLGDDLCVTIIATGFKANSLVDDPSGVKQETIKHPLDGSKTTQITQPIQNPVAQGNKIVHVLNQNEPEESNDLEPSFETQNPTPAQSGLFDDLNTKVSEVEMKFNPLPEVKDETKDEAFTYTVLSNDIDMDVDIPEEYDTLIITNQDKPSFNEERPSREAVQSRRVVRDSKIKEYTNRLRTPSGISDLENEPAYKRRNIELDDTPASSESNISRFTLSEEKDINGETKATLRGNNSFLHDNVD